MTAAQTSNPWYREPYVWLLIAIPGSAVVVGAIMLTVAIETDDGLVADDYYKRGLEINWVLARDEEAARLGLGARMHLMQAASGIELAVSLDTSNAAFSPPQSVVARFSHGTRAGLDRQVSLHRQNDSYVGRIGSLAPGRWNVALATTTWRLTASLHSSAAEYLDFRSRPSH